MKHRKLIVIAAAVMVLAAAAMIITYCTRDYGKNSYDASLYFYNEASTTIEAENRTVRYTTDENLVEEIVWKLISGPEVAKHKRVIPNGARLLSVEGYDKGQLTVNFSRDFLSGDENKDIQSVYSVVKSLCTVRGIVRVKVVVEGTEIVLGDGSIVGYLTDQDINLSTDTVSSEMRAVTLYFPVKDGNTLAKEVHTIRVTDQQPVAQYIINELIKGPQNENLIPSLSADTTIHSVEISNRICFVNFKENFIEKNSGVAEQEKLTVFSIVDSLTELDNIDRVQFLIDGKRVDDFGNINISGFFGRDENIIG
ncbi:MAG: GerMN domain-containing protein [Clostridia bacterium]|nr:GerMN domain-containing protein [Clostridia bacterium]